MKEDAPLTQAAFGRLIGVSQQRVSQYLRDGFVRRESMVRVGLRFRILPGPAIRDLLDNLDPLFFTDTAKLERLAKKLPGV